MDSLEFALMVEDTDHGPASRRSAADARTELSHPDERAAFHAARYLLELADAALEQIDGRTLDLTRQRERIQVLTRTVDQARTSAIILQDGLTRPAAAWPVTGPPTLGQAARWQELRGIEDIQREALLRDQAAGRRFAGREPDSWTIRPRPRGCFTARRTDGLAVGGWAETPETVPDALRAWSLPAGSAVSVTWTPPDRPVRRRRRFDGWPGSVCPHPARQWEAEPPERIAVFAAALGDLRASWPPGDLPRQLAETASRLNAEEPQAPRLGHLACGGRSHDGSILLGRTQTAEWVDPVAIACTGTPRWNEFGSHRPGRVRELAAVLLGDGDPAEAADVWAYPVQPVDLTRVPGPAGPLYEIGGNGMHRMHTGRLTGFALLWATVDQFTLPTSISWAGVADPGKALTDKARDTIVCCWRGALQHGLIDGDLDATQGKLHLTWALAPWLLSRPDVATAWARTYERAYPGTLAGSGIPPGAWQTPGHWKEWLAG
jgi:hypothetical protein